MTRAEYEGDDRCVDNDDEKTLLHESILMPSVQIFFDNNKSGETQ